VLAYGIESVTNGFVLSKASQYAATQGYGPWVSWRQLLPSDTPGTRSAPPGACSWSTSTDQQGTLVSGISRYHKVARRSLNLIPLPSVATERDNTPPAPDLAPNQAQVELVAVLVADTGLHSRGCPQLLTVKNRAALSAIGVPGLGVAGGA
jgi:hypothetical protein